MFLSRACEYGIWAVLFLAQGPADAYISVKKIAEDLNIPQSFLGKIVQVLTQAGLLLSYKGPTGGVMLAKPADEIKLSDVVEAIDGLDFLGACVVGLGQCSDNHPCPLHNTWKKIREEIQRMLDAKSIGKLAREIQQKELRLANTAIAKE